MVTCCRVNMRTPPLRAHWWECINEIHKIETCIQARSRMYKQKYLCTRSLYRLETIYRFIHYRGYAHINTCTQEQPSIIRPTTSDCEICFSIFPLRLPAVHSFTIWARAVGVCQKSFQWRPCFRLRALSPVRATSLNTADKASSMPQPQP